jgi:protein involved in temperature-dependent protein secretion
MLKKKADQMKAKPADSKSKAIYIKLKPADRNAKAVDAQIKIILKISMLPQKQYP